MRKIVFLFTLALLAISTTQAQLIPDVDRSKVKRTVKGEIPSAPAPAPPPPPVNKTTTTTESGPVSVYSLTSVRVKVRTGNDNKEFPSKVSAFLSIRNKPGNEPVPFVQWNVVNEMKINSDTDFGLDRQEQLGESKLDAFQSSGLRFFLRYSPNFFADAWKIENLSLILEFKDQFGNLHPTLGNKTIVFSNAYGFLNNEYQVLECVTDGSFAPINAIIKK